ncbi:N,N-dimethylformamidase beta subunit family domain-containing protein [Micromonospora sp. CA-111912]|uniref:N,N-dimethylformamidase beta subunit family domain-containing protein n=1 Tax=Micromonospora sp. CA-111912 TaxID=3239955 RepID=UPI003D8DA4AB
MEMSRRDLLRAAGIAGAAMTPLVGAGEALAADRAVGAGEAAGPEYDPQQRFVQVVGGGSGVLYGIRADGALLWYRHVDWQTVGTTWASGSGRIIGDGFHQFVSVFGGVDGSLYCLRGDGTLHRYRYVCSNLETGAGSWAAPNGVQIGNGFDKYPRLFGFNGYVYGVTAAGDVYAYRFNPTTGTWINGSGTLIGNFKTYQLYADDSGVVYAVRYGYVYWHRYTGGAWASGSGMQIGSGFTNLMYVGLIAAGQGALYGVNPGVSTQSWPGSLVEYRLNNWTTAGADQSASWANGGAGKIVNAGWTIQRTAALQGYTRTNSVRPGETVHIATSSTFATFTATMVRVAPSAAAPVEVAAPVTVAGGVQPVPTGFVHTGCGWADTLSVPIPADLPSGLYAMRLEGPHGLRRHLPFIVKPVVPANRVALIFPTNTYHAYNTYGNHSQYCSDLTGVRTLSLRRPSTELNVEVTGNMEHTLYSDVLLTRWMTEENIGFDSYNDTDLHLIADWSPYDAVVLGSHPEYWSEAMRQHMIAYVAGGGRLIYTGGNGVYERVSFSADLGRVNFRKTTGARDVLSGVGMPASELIGVNYIDDSWFTFAPYRVVNNHALLAGTGLAVGDQFGHAGYNGAASGWEVDTFLGLAGEATEAQVIARGTNPGGGASMVFMEKPNGGFVFSASSITFNGALATDAAVSTILRNVFTLALPGT